MRCFHRGSLAAGASLVALFSSHAATAQVQGTAQASPPQQATDTAPKDVPPATNGDIIVTALKQGPQTLTSTPAAVSVLTGSAIENSGARSLTDVLQLTPGVSIAQAAVAGSTAIQIRGVSSTFGAATVGFYLDDLPFSLININYLPDPSVYDLDRVEVLRGPQGTLYGAGAAGGVVLVRTHDPVLGVFEGKAEGRISSTDGGGTNYETAGAINVPVISDRAALRLSASYTSDPGWINAPNQGNGVNDYNDEKHLDVRGKFLVEPIDHLRIQLQASIDRINTGGTPNADDRDNWLGVPDVAAKVNYEQYGAKVNYDFPGLTVSSTGSFLHWRNVSDIGSIVSVPSDTNFNSFAQELRLNSRGDGPFSWVAGAFYKTGKLNLFEDASKLGLPVNIDEHIRSKQENFFGEGTLALFNRALDLTAGASYFHDHTYNFSTLAAFSPLPINNEVSTNRLSPKVNIAYHPSEHTTIYANFARGFRPATLDFTFSTFFAQLVIPSITGRVSTEDDTAYELGAKADLLDKKVHAEVALFHNEIKNIQQSASVLIPGTTTQTLTVLNAGNASTSGVEVFLGVQPTRALQLSVSGSYTDSRIGADFYAPGANPATATPLYFKGDPLNQVPKWQAAFTASHKHHFGNVAGLASVSLQYASKRPLSFLSLPPIYGEDNVRIDARYELSKGRWTGFVFAENLLNDQHAISPSVYSTTFTAAGFPQNGITASRLRPRTIGLGVRTSF